MWRPLTAGLRVLIALLFIATGVAKAIDASEVRAVMAYLFDTSVASPLVTASAAAIVASVEVILGLLLLTAPRLRATLYGSALLVIGYTAVLFTLALDRDAPSCGCLGVLTVGRDATAQSVAGIVRNMGIIGAIGLLLLERSRFSAVRSGRRRAGIVPMRAIVRRGFSLVEVLVVIVVIGILMALALPALKGARRQAHNASALQTISQLHAATFLYGADHREAFPYLAIPGKPDAKLVVNGHLLKHSAYFQQSRYFVNLLHPHYYDDRGSIERPYGSGVPDPPDVIVSRFDITNCVFAAPAYWVGDVPPDDPHLFRGTRFHDVMFPAHKGLLLDLASDLLEPSGAYRTEGRGLLTVGMSDGSAGYRSADDALPTVTRPFGSTPLPIMSTESGLHGRDFN